VPIGVSGFETRTESGKEVMGYHGEFAVDPTTKTLKELVILTDDIPESAQVCAFISTTRYETNLLNNVPF
jgi:hypothetical protein